MTDTFVHEEFHNCLTACPNDDYFRDLFIDCSRGKFPKNFYFNVAKKEVRALKNNSNDVVYYTFTNDNEENYKSLRNIFQSTLQLLSPEENQKLIVKSSSAKKNALVDEFHANDWKNVKNATVKNMILDSFIEKGILPSYPHCKADAIKKTIDIGFSSKRLKSEDIVIQDGVIVELKNLDYDEETKSFILKRQIKLTKKK